MRRFFLAAAALFVAVTAHAQLLDFEGMPPYKLGITAGANMSSFSAPRQEYAYGVQAGADLIVSASSIIPSTYGRVQLKYSMKGSKGPEEWVDRVYLEDGQYKDRYQYTNYRVHYLEIPIHYGYGWRMDDDWTFTGETGPYLAIGLAGTASEHKPTDTYAYAVTNRSFFKYYDASRFDFGWGVQLGVLYGQSYMLNVSYDWGFKNLTPGLLQNNNLSVGLTYFIE